MKTSSKALLGTAAALLVALALFFLLRPSGLTDQEQIQSQLESARAAAQAHNVSGIMQIVSDDYKDAVGLNVDQLHLMLGRGVQQSGLTQVTMTPPQVTVTGDTATSTCHVTTVGGQVPFDRTVTLTWRHEDGHKYLVVPTKVWRVVGADYGSAIGED